MKPRPNPHSRLLDADEQPPIDPLLQIREPQMRDADLGPPPGWAARALRDYRASVAPRRDAWAEATADGAG